jgi:hypothetical protein
MSVGLPSYSKVMLILDNCAAHRDAELLIKDNVFAVYLLPNCTNLIRPIQVHL